MLDFISKGFILMVLWYVLLYSLTISSNLSIYIFFNIEVIYLQILFFTLRKKYSYSELFWSAFSCIMTEYGVIPRIQSECGKMRNRITPNTDIFCAVLSCSWIFQQQQILLNSVLNKFLYHYLVTVILMIYCKTDCIYLPWFAIKLN